MHLILRKSLNLYSVTTNKAVCSKQTNIGVGVISDKAFLIWKHLITEVSEDKNTFCRGMSGLWQNHMGEDKEILAQIGDHVVCFTFDVFPCNFWCKILFWTWYFKTKLCQHIWLSLHKSKASKRLNETISKYTIWIHKSLCSLHLIKC